MNEVTWQKIQELRDDARLIELAADKLFSHGAMRLAEQVRVRVREWRAQADEMEQRGQLRKP